MTNSTKIKFIKVLDRLYEVEKISFYDFSVSAKETDLTLGDVPAEEVFDITEMRDFRIKLRNWHGNITDFKTYVENRKIKS